MIIPPEKNEEIKTAHKQIEDVEKQYRKGVITPGERYNKIIDIWTNATDKISNVMLQTLEEKIFFCLVLKCWCSTLSWELRSSDSISNHHFLFNHHFD